MARDKAYQIAEKKIEEAGRSGALDLSVGYSQLAIEGLLELPESLRELTELQILNLSHNQIAMLPEWLGELTQLQSLDLSHNKLTALPDSLSRLTELQSLNISRNGLTALPESLGQLSKLETLNNTNNQVTAVPDWIRELKNLRKLWLGGNQLTILPPWVGELMHLEFLGVSQNGLTSLPDSLGNLKKLERLDTDFNQLTSLPDSFEQDQKLSYLDVCGNQLKGLPASLGRLPITDLYLGDPLEADAGNPLQTLPDVIRNFKELRLLWAPQCQLDFVPSWIGDLSKISHLNLNENNIRDLPSSLTRLEDLRELELKDNLLNPELAAAYEEGLDAVKRYLQELTKGARKRYEAKLLVLGDGNEGKTCVSRALRGLPFQPQVTTRGVDVEQWKFAHPDDINNSDKTITLNIWDFEGQEINHQTHQFFLSTQALYLLVFKCRDQFPMARAEYWLDTIRARAPQARVAIVISESEERTPYVPRDKFEPYRDLLAGEGWLFAVGCKDNSGIPKLQQFLKRSAADLEFMGREWPESYSRAEDAIKNTATKGAPHISRAELHEVFRGCRIDENIFKDVAGSMSILGVITQFPECPDLRDFIVLQPQWLTKAISEIMENRQLEADQGEITLQRMQGIWDGKGYSGMFPTFHDCMKEFELCYDLEDASRSCLVPLRFGYKKPAIPWSDHNGMKERLVEYKLNIRPPSGLMSRFIVKTHHMIVTSSENPNGVYWHNGVFLRTGSGPFVSEGLCEFDTETRKLRVQVRAAFPQNLLEQIHGYVKAVFSFFIGLEAQRSYGCIKFDEQTGTEKKCAGVHSENRIYSAMRNQRVLDCEYEFHDVDPQKLIWGFSTFGEYVMAKVASIDELRKELDKKPEWAENLTHDVVKLLRWLEEQRENIRQLVEDQATLLPEIKQQLELKLHEYLGYTSEMLDDRDQTAAPGIISISTEDRSKWNPTSYFQKTYVLTPFCENDRNVHPCADGQVKFTKDRQWWESTAPWIARGTRLLAAGLQLAFAGMPLALGSKVFDAIKDDVKFMSELSKHIALEDETKNVAGATELLEGELGKDLRSAERESRLMRAALARFLEETAPTNYRARQWGSLRRLRMSDNSYRWICESCIQSSKTQ